MVFGHTDKSMIIKLELFKKKNEWIAYDSINLLINYFIHRASPIYLNGKQIVTFNWSTEDKFRNLSQRNNVTLFTENRNAISLHSKDNHIVVGIMAETIKVRQCEELYLCISFVYIEFKSHF